MRKIIYIAVALLIGATACQVVETPEPAADRIIISISADPVYEEGWEPETKAVIHGTKMYWTPGDTLGVFPGRGSQVYFLVDSEGEAVSAPFDGGDWEFKANAVYRSYYPFYGDIYLNPAKIPIQFYKERNGRVELQTQVGNDSSVHTSEYLYMFTDPQEVINESISFAYHHLWTVLKPIVELPAGHYTKLTFSLDEPLFVEKGYFDLTSDTPAIIVTEFANEVSMNLDITFDAPTTLTAYYATAPLDMQGKTLTITITEESGAEYTYTYNPSKAYKAGTTYKLTSSESFTNNIVFCDMEVKAICVTNWDTNGDGELSYDEAAAVTDLSNAFKERRDITSFDELRYFTSLNGINPYAFLACSSLTSITLPPDVEFIGLWAFRDCLNLASINIPSNVRSIGEDAFLNCSNLISLQLPDDLAEIKKGAFASCTNLVSINIPSSVTTIGINAFRDCSSLESIIIPSGVTAIERGAFSGCSSLNSVNIPAEVTSIGEKAFYACKGLSTIILPERLVTIDNEAFKHCSNLETIIIPEEVTFIGRSAFESCVSLSSTTIPPGVTSIMEQTFYYCTNLNSISLPSGVISIGEKSFWQCSSLLSVTLPETLTSIGRSAFYGCKNLTSILVNPGTPPSGGSDMFMYTNNCPIYVPAESVEYYISAWSEYADWIQAIPIPVMGVNIDESELMLYISETRTLVATVLPENATNKVVDWSSSNPSVATVDSEGIVTAVGGGAAIITATTEDGGFSATCDVNVIAPTSISLSSNSLSVKRGSTVQLTATITPTEASDYPVTWSSSNSNVVSVDENGNVTGKVKDRTATITATAGTVKATCTVTVTAPDMVSFSLSPSSLQMFPGDDVEVTITPNPSDAVVSSSSWFIDYEIPAIMGGGNDLTRHVLAVEPGNTQVRVVVWDGTRNIEKYLSVTVLDPCPNAIDLGLSVKWAERNFMALSTTDSGRFFTWAEAARPNSTYDIVQEKTGGEWRMPTRSDMQELLDNCTYTQATQDGVQGVKFTSKINGKTLFLPNVGGYSNGTFYPANQMGCYYWSKTHDGSSAQSGYRFRWLVGTYTVTIEGVGVEDYKFVLRPVQ